MSDIYAYAAGIDFQIVARDEDGDAIDLSSASEISMLFLCPGGGNLLTVTPSFLTDGTDGTVSYLSQAGDIDTVGVWKYQLKAEWPDGKIVYTDESTFTAKRPLDH